MPLVVLAALLLVGCAGGKREAPLLNINVSSVEERIDAAEEQTIAPQPTPRPRVVTRLVPTAPPRVCQCR